MNFKYFQSLLVHPHESFVVARLYPSSKSADTCSACMCTEFAHSYDSMQTSCCLAACFSSAKMCFSTSIQSGGLRIRDRKLENMVA